MKTWFRDLRLRRKLTLIIMITAGGALVFAGAVLIAWDTFQRRLDFIRDLTTLADIVAENSMAALSFNDADAATETLATLQARPRVDAAALYDGHGRVIARYHRTSEHHVVPTVPGGEGYDFTADGLALFKPIHVKGTPAGTLYLHSDLSEFSSRARVQVGAFGLVLLVSLGLAFIVSNRLQTLVSDPILALAQTARTVSREKNYSLRASAPGADELGTLVGAFNDMLAEIQQRETSLRESETSLRDLAGELSQAVRVRDDFLATAAHELRNPLNAIQLQLVGIL